MKILKSTFLLVTGTLIAIAALIAATLPNTNDIQAGTSNPTPQIVDSTLEYLRYSVELSQIMQEKFSNPILIELAREIEAENQKQTRKLVALIINREWTADYKLDKNLKKNIRMLQIRPYTEASDLYFTELQNKIKQLQALYECNSSEHPENELNLALIQNIILQQTQFSEDIGDIVAIRMQALNN